MSYCVICFYWQKLTALSSLLNYHFPLYISLICCCGTIQGGIVGNLLEATNERPWLWVLFVIVVILPFVLIAVCCFPSGKVCSKSIHFYLKPDTPMHLSSPRHNTKFLVSGMSSGLFTVIHTAVSSFVCFFWLVGCCFCFILRIDFLNRNTHQVLQHLRTTWTYGQSILALFWRRPNKILISPLSISWLFVCLFVCLYICS